MKNTLILTLDFINDIVHPEGKIASFADRIVENQTIQKANAVIQWGRINNLALAHVKVGFSKNYLECPKNSPMFSKAKEYSALMLDSWGCQFVDELDVKTDDFIITKHRVNAFYNTDLETLLRAQKIEQIIMFGVSTSYAVEHTARDAHDRDYQVVIVKDASEALNDQAHQGSLTSLERFCKIIDSSQLDNLS